MSSAVARKYGRALAEVALEKGRQEEVRADLAGFGILYQENKELQNVLQNPVIPFSSKRNIITQIAMMGPLGSEVRNFLYLLLQNNRIQLLSEIQLAFQDILNEKLGILRGQVYSSVILAEEQRTALETRLESKTSRKVQLAYYQDPSLIGGVKIQVGSVIYDATVQKQLEEIQRRIF
ncbi:MAG: ATP synthase F1 subunit delta [Acidobacteria bacterium]|nr:ATP synthase F1 subunit delta [Acidobacteriota bacterium]